MGAVVFCLLFSISLRYAIIHIHAQWKIISGLVSVTFDYWLKRRGRAKEKNRFILTIHTWKSDFLSAVEFLNPAKTERMEKKSRPIFFSSSKTRK